MLQPCLFRSWTPKQPEFFVGPYEVLMSIERVRGRRPMRFWKMREEDSPGWTRVYVGRPGTTASRFEVLLVEPWPNEVRLGCTALLDGTPARVTKRWFSPVEIATPTPISINRSGPSGFRIVEEATGRVLADRRWGRDRIDADLPNSVAAVVVAAGCTSLSEAVSPFAWMRGI